MNVDIDNRIIMMRKDGMSCREISRAIGKTAAYVSTISRNAGIFGNITQHIFSDDKVTELLSGIGFEYVSGYSGTKSIVTVRCKKCGGMFARRFDMWFARQKNGGSWCPVCIERTRKQKIEQGKEAKREARINAERRKMEREADLISRQTEARLANHVCKNCGAIYCIGVTGYNSEQYCSEKCMKRWAMRVKNDRRLKRIQAREHDSDITLEKLYARDNGLCYICGGSCDWASVDKDGNAQDEYPSIDHVVPLSKGGKHKWDNVKLAHRGCNTRKGDRDTPLG